MREDPFPLFCDPCDMKSLSKRTASKTGCYFTWDDPLPGLEAVWNVALNWVYFRNRSRTAIQN